MADYISYSPAQSSSLHLVDTEQLIDLQLFQPRNEYAQHYKLTFVYTCTIKCHLIEPIESTSAKFQMNNILPFRGK